MRFTKKLSWTIILLVLSACASQKIVGNNAELRAEMKTGTQEVKEALKPRIEESKKHGPQVQETPMVELRKQQRVLVNQAERTATMDGQAPLAKVSLNLVDTDMREVAQLFTEITGINFVVGQEVHVAVTVKLNDIAWDSALDSILKMYALTHSHDRRGNVIRIHKPEALVALDEFDRKRAEESRKAVDVQHAAEPQDTEIFHLFYTKPDKMKASLDAVFKPQAQAAGTATAVAGPSIVVDTRTNALIIKGTRTEIEAAARLIEQLDMRTRQILIEAFIVEVTDDFDKEFGARLGLMGKKTASNKALTVGGGMGTTAAGTAADTPADMTFATNSGLVSNVPLTSPLGSIGALLGNVSGTWALKAELMAMETLNLTKIISNPRIFTMDNEEASITSGEQVAYTVAGASGGQPTYEYKDAALKLTVTPSIVGDGNILLNVTVNKDSVIGSGAAPLIDKKEVKSKMLIKDGAIAVIGGIYKQTRNENVAKVPVLGDIPVLGTLFRHNTSNDERKELLIFLAPSML